ncbi:IGSF1 protein, partial [Eurystomus gularis]|nr:IGSF1 protein [Eurystomus gularis]
PAIPPPPPPNISLTPVKPEYLIGDTISIRCEAPWTKEKIQSFQFSGTSGWAVDIRSSKRTYVHTYNITGPKDGGAHTCNYVVLSRSQLVRSKDSRSIIISVKDRPPQPTLTTKPSTGVTIEGQPLVFSCAAPPAEAERRFHFYNEQTEVMDGVMTSTATQADLLVATSSQNHTGNISCAYEEKTEGRWILSYHSQGLEVLVKEAASPPVLVADPLSRVVGEAQPLSLTCVASREDFELRFRFYRNGAEMPPGEGGSETRRRGNFSELVVPRSSRSFEGNFSCQVEEKVGGAWVASGRSQVVAITVKALSQLIPLVAGGVAGGVALLLGLLLAVCLCRRQRAGVHWKGLYDKEDPSTYPMANVNSSDA